MQLRRRLRPNESWTDRSQPRFVQRIAVRKLVAQELHHAHACVISHEIVEARRHIAVACSLYESAPAGTVPPQVGNVILWAERAIAARELSVVVMALEQGLQLLDDRDTEAAG